MFHTHCPAIGTSAHASWGHPAQNKARRDTRISQSSGPWPGLLSGADGAGVISSYSGDPWWDTAPWRGGCEGSTAPPISQALSPTPRLGEQHVQHLWKGFQSQRDKGLNCHIISKRGSCLTLSGTTTQAMLAEQTPKHSMIHHVLPALEGKTALGTAGFDTAWAKDGKTSSHFQRNTTHFLMEESHSLSFT